MADDGLQETMTLGQAREYVRGQVEIFIDNVMEGDAYSKLNFLHSGAVSLNKGDIVDAISAHFYEDVYSYFNKHGSVSAKELNKIIEIRLAKEIDNVGQIRVATGNSVATNRDFFAAVIYEYARAGDSAQSLANLVSKDMFPIIAPILSSADSRNEMVKCLYEQKANMNEETKAFLASSMVDVAIKELGMKRPDFLQHGESDFPNIPAICKTGKGKGV